MCKLFGDHPVQLPGANANINQADGRDSDLTTMSSPFHISREVFVPQLENGSLRYSIMEIVAASDTDSGWTVKQIPTQEFPMATGTSADSIRAVDGIGTQRLSVGGLQAQ